MNTLFIKILLLLTPIYSYAVDLAFEESIEIKKPIEEVFDYTADARNDENWRTEVHSITTDGPFEVGTVFTEDAFLGLHYNYITKVRLNFTGYPTSAIYRTTEDNPYRLESHRYFTSLDENTTRFTYRVYVEKALVYDILFRGVPLSVAEQGYRSLMRFYLRNLRRKLEYKGL